MNANCLYERFPCPYADVCPTGNRDPDCFCKSKLDFYQKRDAMRKQIVGKLK